MCIRDRCSSVGMRRGTDRHTDRQTGPWPQYISLGYAMRNVTTMISRSLNCSVQGVCFAYGKITYSVRAYHTQAYVRTCVSKITHARYARIVPRTVERMAAQFPRASVTATSTSKVNLSQFSQLSAREWPGSEGRNGSREAVKTSSDRTN